MEGRCKKCAHYDACCSWIRHGKALYDDFAYGTTDCPYFEASNGLRAVWIQRLHEDPRGDYHLYHCSACDTASARQRNFCAECGAKMSIKLELES